MCQMSMKLQLPCLIKRPLIKCTFDKIVKNSKPQKMLSKLGLEPKYQGHSRNQKIMTWGKTCHPKQGVP